MRLLPNEKFTIQTQEPLSKVIEKLEAHIEDPKIFRWPFSRNHAPYAGTISDSGFKIYRIIHYRNSFLPIIRGKFESSKEGTKIHVTMNLNPFVMVFLIFLFLPFFSIISIFIFLLILENGFVLPEILFLGLPIFVLFIFWCAFWYEANRSRQELTQIIEGKPLKLQTFNKRNY